MSHWATFGQGRLISATLVLPMYGLWTADIMMALGTSLPTTGTLTLGDMTLVGSVQRVANFAGSRGARLVGGYGGWQKSLPSYGYSNPAGVSVASVVKDAASAVGEQVVVGSSASLGTFFVREAGPASRVLRQIGGSLYWVDPTGVTQVGPRPATPIGSAFQVLSWSGAKGQFAISTETLADWQPGRTFTAPTVTTPQNVSLVTITTDNDGATRLDVLGAP